MEKSKLISMTDFVIEQRKKQDTDNIRRFWACEKYANFLKQPLELWMFVPCDEDGNVLEQPKEHFPTGNNNLEESIFKIKEQFNKAKKRCLFDGFERGVGQKNAFTNYKGNHLYRHDNNIFSMNGKSIFTIEDIIFYNLTLTATAQKQINNA